MAVLQSVCCCLLLIFCTVLQAGPRLFRCVDAAGNIEFQQRLCPTGEQNAVDVMDTRIGWQPPKVVKGVSKTAKKRVVRSRASMAKDAQNSVRQDKSCWRAKQNLEQAEMKLRRGYKASAGDRLRSQRARHESYLREFC